VSAVHDEAGIGLQLLIAARLLHWNCVIWGKKHWYSTGGGVQGGMVEFLPTFNELLTA
jgi:hypothetical protein